jgi:hypothetical protein
VLVCGGDGSVGWVLKEIDELNLHKKCQIGVLPLGTGNDLARVLGWGAVLDDDNQLPKLLESFERATTKMLDRWSIMTYETPILKATSITNTSNINNINTATSQLNVTCSIPNDNNNNDNHNNNNQNSPPEFKTSFYHDNDHDLDHEATNFMQSYNFARLEETVWYHLNNMLQNENISQVIESSLKFNDTLNELLIKVYTVYSEFTSSNNSPSVAISEEELRKVNAMQAVVTDQCISLKFALDEFFLLLKNELKPNLSKKVNVKNVLEKAQKSMTSSESEEEEEERNQDDQDIDKGVYLKHITKF